MLSKKGSDVLNAVSCSKLALVKNVSAGKGGPLLLLGGDGELSFAGCTLLK